MPPNKSAIKERKKLLECRLKNHSVPPAIQTKQRIKKKNPKKYLHKSNNDLIECLLTDKNATDAKMVSTLNIKQIK